MLAGKLTLLLAVAGQAKAAFTLGHRAVHAYAETDTTTSLKHDKSAGQGKLVVATQTLGDLTYTYLSSDFTAESATSGPGEVLPLATSANISILTKTATATATSTETLPITLTTIVTLMANTVQPATATYTLPALETADLPFHIHGGGDYTSITFFGGYGTPTTSTAHSTSTTVAPYAHSINTDTTTQHQSPSATQLTTTPTTVSTSTTTSSSASSASSVPSSVPSSSSFSTSSLTVHSTTSSPPVSLSSSSLSTTSTPPASTLSGLTVPAGSATATQSPNAAETHGHSAGCRAKAGVNTMVFFMVLVYIMVL